MGFYDNEIKRVCERCPRLLILAINAIFKKNHDQNQKVSFLNRELNLDPDENPQFLDMLIGLDDAKYHIEFQLLEGKMALRMYEYGVKESVRALPEDADKYEIDVVMPHQAVIFLAGVNKKTEIKVNLTLPDEQKVSYTIRCISASATVDYLSEEDLYILLPFQQVQLNERITRLTEASADGTRKLLAKEIIDYRNAANDKLEKLVDADIIKPHERETLVEAAINIETYLKKKDEKVSREVKRMGDENYIAWSDQLRMEGQELGIEKGRELGREEGIEVLIIDNLEDGKSEEQIISKVVKRFNVSEAKAKEYFDRFAVTCC